MNILFFLYLLLVILLNRRYNWKLALSGAIAGTIHLGWYFPHNVFLYLYLFLLYSTVIFLDSLYYLTNKTQLDLVKGEVKELQERLNKARFLYKRLKEENSKQEQELEQLVVIYECIRKWSSTLEFVEAITIFHDGIRSLCRYDEGLLVIQGDNQREEYYSLAHRLEKPRMVKKLKATEKSIIEYVKNAPRSVYRLRLEKDKCIEDNSGSILTIPLGTPLHPTGFLILDGVSTVDTDKIRLLCTQFSMEIMKTVLYSKVRRLSMLDSLTGLYLRNHFIALLEKEIDRALKKKVPFSILMIDIDHFKKINDEYGHLIGDMILKEVADIIKLKTREQDIICRYGGEEIIIALPKADKNGAILVAERLRKSVEERRFSVGEEQIRVTLSIGIFTWLPSFGKDIEEFIKNADEALYIAKARGRNRIEIFEK